MSLVGNISADGSASFFDTVGRLADRTKARHYPMPLPFLMSSERERDQMLKIDPIARVRAVAAKADLRLVGVGQMDQQAQVHVDGFVSREELLEMMRLGAVGELTGWAFDKRGHLIKGGTNLRLTSIPPRVPAQALTIGAAVGRAKVSAIRAALKGRLLNGLITDEATAGAILKALANRPVVRRRRASMGFSAADPVRAPIRASSPTRSSPVEVRFRSLTTQGLGVNINARRGHMLNVNKGGYREARPQRPAGRGYLVGCSPFHRSDNPDHRHREQ